MPLNTREALGACRVGTLQPNVGVLYEGAVEASYPRSLVRLNPSPRMATARWQPWRVRPDASNARGRAWPKDMSNAFDR